MSRRATVLATATIFTMVTVLATATVTENPRPAGVMSVESDSTSMDDPEVTDGPIDDVPELVDKNGLVELFANRARARILVTLFYANEPLTVAEIANGAGMNRSTVHEALEQLDAFDFLEALDGADDPRYRLRSDDDLVEAVRNLAELATDRLYGGRE